MATRTDARRLRCAELVLASLVLALSSACSEPPAPPAPAPSEASGQVEVDRGPAPARPVSEARQAIRENFDEAWSEYAQHAIGTPLRHLLLEESDVVPLRRRAFLAALYHARDWQPIFVADGAGSFRAVAVLETLHRAPEHALNPETYLRPGLLDALQQLAELRPAWAARPEVLPTRSERDALLDLLAVPEVEAADDALFALLDRALASDSSPVGELAAVHAERMLIEQAMAGQSAIAEALIADAFLAWAFDQRHFNLATVDEDLSIAERDAVIAERMRGSFQSMAGTDTREAAAAYMETLQPHHPQYALLMAERARYQAIVDGGGWQRVEPMTLRRGHRHARVAQLKQRLQVEGYYTGPIDEVFDAPLEEAMRLYQETHQLEVTGESSRVFWNSLNVSADDRLAQIELTMQRWREGRAGDDPYYIHVNIPDFHAEVWRNGVRELRFRIVVGNTQRVCDASTGTWRYPNATPIQSATMSYVTLNPMWNIPPRILEEELLPNLLEDETYFAEQGIERVVENGVVRVRQIPGPANPLGRVKFMFPNPHDTYMHDTSRPQYFQYPVRAFSHGCMRVQNPLDFLEYLLRNDGQWDESNINRIFESNVETSIRLRTPIPVHVEYFVVRVDDDGRANFLSDIYRYDRDRLAPPSSADLRCTPPEAPTTRLVLGEDARPRLRDLATGELIDPADPEARARLGLDPDDPADPAAGDIGP